MVNKQEIEINKNILEYKESIFLGFDLRESFFSIIAAGIAVMEYLNLKDIIGTEITTWIVVISVIPFAAMAFVKYQGMSMETLFINAWYSFLLCRNKELRKEQNNEKITKYRKFKVGEEIAKKFKKQINRK